MGWSHHTFPIWTLLATALPKRAFDIHALGMTKHAESIHKKQQRGAKFEEEWTLHAAQIYQEGQGSSSGSPLSLQGALERAKQECLVQTGKIVSLNTSRIHHRVQTSCHLQG
jgi:hypothetical protein